MLVAVFAFGQNQNVKDVEVTAPQFTGVENAVVFQTGSPNTLIKNYLKENIVYPKEAAYCSIEGTEVVKFKVTTGGNVKDFEIINSVCPEMDKEVIKALALTNGMWIPGVRNGQPDDMTIEIPFTFCTTATGSKAVQEKFTERATSLFSKGSQMLFEKGKTKKALYYYDKGVTYLPYDQSLLMLRGMCRYELGDKEGATEDWMRMGNLGGPDMSEVTELVKDMKGYDEMFAILKK